MVDNRAADMRLLPVMSGMPSPLQYTAGASLPPGDYTLKLAVAEGERVGTVEHVIHAALPAASGITTSELMVGGPLDVGELLAPTIGYQITFGVGARVRRSVRLAARVDDDGIRDRDGRGRAGAPQRRRPGATRRRRPRHLHQVVPVHALPPGRYLLRAILSSGGRSITTLTRGFEIAAPKVLMTVGRRTGRHVGRRRALSAGRRRGDDAGVSARSWR